MPYPGGLSRRQGDGAPIFPAEAYAAFFKQGAATEFAEDVAAVFGAVNQPTSGSIGMLVERYGSFFKVDFTLTAARVPVTDDGANGSFGTLKITDLIAGAWKSIGCRQNYSAFAGDGSGVPADAVLEIGIGSAAISAAADGSLGATEDDIGGDVNQTLGQAATGTTLTGDAGPFDGTATALDLNLNVSGTAATVDGNGYVDLTGTISILLAFLGDD